MDATASGLDIDYRALALWAIDQKTTSSSKLLARVALGIPLEKRSSRMHPTDAADMGCCITLVRNVAGIRERLVAARFLSPVWSAIVDAWSELEGAYDQDEEISRQHDLKWKEVLKEANDSEEGWRIVEAFEELPEPKSMLRRRLWVVLEEHGGPLYHGLVAAYDHADEPIELESEVDLDDDDFEDIEDEDDLPV